MTPEECEHLIRTARAVLERYLFDADGQVIRDDIAEICMKIDEAFPGGEDARAPGTVGESLSNECVQAPLRSA
jgi:hypothetical protein